MLKNPNFLPLFLNAAVYCLTAYVAWRKFRFPHLGTVLLLIYASMAVVCLHIFQNPLLQRTFSLTFFPFVYLYVMLMLAFLPFFFLRERRITAVKPPSRSCVNILCLAVIVTMLPGLFSTVRGFKSSVSSMMADASTANEIYRENLSTVDQRGDKTISILGTLSNAFQDIAVFLLVYYLTLPKKNKFILAGLFLSLLTAAMASIARGSRGSVVVLIIEFVCWYIFLRKHIAPRTRSVMRKVMIAGGAMLIIPIILITIGRFNTGVEKSAVFYTEYYYAQPYLYFNEFGLDAGGTRNGDRLVPLFKKMLFMETPKNRNELRQKYSNLKMDDSVFSTFVGDFTLDFGPEISFVIFFFSALFFSLYFRRIRGEIPLDKLLMVFFLMCCCLSFFLFRYADVGGNLKIILYGLVFLYLKVDYGRRKPAPLSPENPASIL